MKAEFHLQCVSKSKINLTGTQPSHYYYISLQIRKYFGIALKFFYPFPNISKVFPQRYNLYPTLNHSRET